MANFNIPYKTEREGQMEFFDNYGIPYSDDDSILVDNTDGVYKGNIFEFKLTINNLNKVLYQVLILDYLICDLKSTKKSIRFFVKKTI